MNRYAFGKRMIENIGLGAVLGYAVLHPASVVIYNMSAPDVASFTSSVVSAFHWDHRYMALYFTAIGLAFGILHGLNMHRLAKVHAKVEKLSLTDELTGLYNRRYFAQILAREQGRTARYGNDLSVMMIDIDHFKRYNDKNGHPAGDRLLQRFAERLLSSARQTDIVARCGGEEFLILMPDTDIDMAAHLAERIRKDIEAYPFAFQEAQPNGNITVSIGCAHLGSAGSPTDVDIIESADQCLYLAKNNGRNRIWC